MSDNTMSDLTSDLTTFREEVRSWLNDNCP